MDLNNQIGGEVDVHGPIVKNQVFKKAIKKEQKLKTILAFQDKTRKRFGWSKSSTHFKKEDMILRLRNKDK